MVKKNVCKAAYGILRKSKKSRIKITQLCPFNFPCKVLEIPIVVEEKNSFVHE